MSILHNIMCKKELKNRMLCEKEPRFTLSFYKYFTINNPYEYRDQIYKEFYKYNVLGRIYVAAEGINAQISVPKNKYFFIKQFLCRLNSVLNNLRINKSLNDEKSFWVLSVKVRKKIVEDGIVDPLFNPEHVGIYIRSKQVNLMLKDTETIFIDMRNSYEYAIGHFEKAIEIKSLTFREQLKKIIKLMEYAKNKRIVMYCTGGIRCEKATAWMHFNGFKYVYHIEGGIIGYVHDAKKNGLPILFKGKNFVFDNRMSEKISDEILSSCSQCNTPSDTYVNCKNNLCHLLFIQCKNCTISFNNCCSLNCMRKI
ncbi:oxygen-dependent tRNA uridine(34) hydroxylase TrhO [Buchnera aphidicola]|uniref:tRNA uridine(34) hydroxylase n=1 Tax=Buchnera aphidicola str. USDA (Myzus persicae) TaxID=1009856 RepID=W0P4L6_BUCMP|nr:rhodanese-related sulfurtransferase [Buchnera aphidicola]AHG60023.1 Ycea [Buchnera aphidicola str. USDA (Myzus persicae)]AHG60603.1 Ycea [Buchnera aphidicola str. W106 (Myzus persicae)]AHG61175.1 Ycea [Buchnera aphidicola str. G002 (Myzus persicae)]AHG61748.1 Ycea [Buchnera aphidicola str. F009 (Myzus persicae)]WAI03292.1 MAG: rhodanese-related sulfurtransferase [Buchnera aphidicola (Myzus persicae)]